MKRTSRTRSDLASYTRHGVSSSSSGFVNTLLILICMSLCLEHMASPPLWTLATRFYDYASTAN